MIKRTLCFSNPAYLSLKNAQLVIKLPEVEKADVVELIKAEAARTIPIEDIGVVVLDNRQITITQGLVEALLENNCAIITCDNAHLPVGLMLPLCGNTTQSERFRLQIDASLPLKKQLWQQTVQCKIRNQAAVLQNTRNTIVKNMLAWAGEVKSGDSDNLEGRAAAYYWRNLFPDILGFTRDRNGLPPNNLLNYGYAILRAVVARALVGSGLLPTLGIHHHNRYNAYCLADDIMEPYRPYVDALVCRLVSDGHITEELTTELKRELLQIPTLDVVINGKRSPLMVAVGQTTASLYRCFSGEQNCLSRNAVTWNVSANIASCGSWSFSIYRPKPKKSAKRMPISANALCPTVSPCFNFPFTCAIAQVLRMPKCTSNASKTTCRPWGKSAFSASPTNNSGKWNFFTAQKRNHSIRRCSN